MKKIENECVDCGQPCRGNACPYRNVPRYYCDICGDLLDRYNHYVVDNQDYCEECLLDEFRRD